MSEPDPEDTRTSRWGTRVAIVVGLCGLLFGSWGLSFAIGVKMTKYDDSVQFSGSGQARIDAKLNEIQKDQDASKKAFSDRFAILDAEIAGLTFMACTTPPLGRCTADGRPKQ